MHYLITIERTGSAEEFAHKLGISRAMLMINLRELKELGAQIEFCKFRNSYIYATHFTVVIKNENLQNIKGGGCQSIMLLDHLRAYL